MTSKGSVRRAAVRFGRPPKDLAGAVGERILEAARKVFLDRGFEGASIEEIAEAARSGKPACRLGGRSITPDRRTVLQCSCSRRAPDCCDGGVSAESILSRTLLPYRRSAVGGCRRTNYSSCLRARCETRQ